MWVERLRRYFCFHKKFLVFNFVSRDFKLRYRRSVLGVLWTLLVPLSSALMYYFAFKMVLKVQIENYPVFVLTGILPWSFFAFCIVESMNAMEANISLLTKAPIPFQVFPLVICTGAFVNLMFGMVVVGGLILYTGLNAHVGYLLLPLLFALLFLMTYALSIISAISFVYLRDLKHIIALAMPMLMYGTPVLYRESMVPEKLSWLLQVNPMAGFFSILRQVVLDGRVPAISELAIFAAWTMGFLAASVLLWIWAGDAVVENI